MDHSLKPLMLRSESDLNVDPAIIGKVLNYPNPFRLAEGTHLYEALYYAITGHVLRDCARQIRSRILVQDSKDVSFSGSAHVSGDRLGGCCRGTFHRPDKSFQHTRAFG